MTAGTAPRIVVAEDESIVRLDIREILEAEGYEVVADTGRGDEALDLVAAHRPDLVLVDIKMPGIDGLSVAAEVARQRSAAVLVLTAFSQRDLVTRAREVGAQGYVVKPFQRDDLIPAIEMALARFADLRDLEARADDLAQQLENRKVIDRAKGQLIDNHALSEADAFRFIQRRAMSERRSMRAVADDVLAGAVIPDN